MTQKNVTMMNAARRSTKAAVGKNNINRLCVGGRGGSKEANKVRYANILTGYSPQCLLNKARCHPLRLRFHFPADTYG